MPTPFQLCEKTSETGIVATLAASPLYRERQATAFDLTTMLDAEEVAAFLQSTQPKEWAKLAKQFPGAEREVLAAQLSALVQKRGTLEVLCNGASFNGINLQLAFFKPSAGLNPEHQARYAGNRFAIVRQIHFSTKTPDQSVDVGILLNGLPIVSIELKNHFTGQNVRHAIAQYRRRDPREAFFARCLVHFAVDDDAAYMATQLQGKETQFLPFNRDTANPIIHDRFASSYLWADFTDIGGRTELGVLKADSLLELIQNYLHFERDEKTGKERFVFPRFHQLTIDLEPGLLRDRRREPEQAWPHTPTTQPLWLARRRRPNHCRFKHLVLSPSHHRSRQRPGHQMDGPHHHQRQALRLHQPPAGTHQTRCPRCLRPRCVPLGRTRQRHQPPLGRPAQPIPG